MATNASLELTSAIGDVLKTSNDQHLDLFQGTYNITQAWIAGDEINQGHGTEIIMTRLSQPESVCEEQWEHFLMCGVRNRGKVAQRADECGATALYSR